jgi:peptide/nickel transport system substrate-binding protein
MRRIFLLLLAAGSLAVAGGAATRPHYGGTLHVATAAAPTTLDPAESGDSFARRNISRLLFDTLVALDARGVPLPALAISWSAESGNQRWQFVLRRGVTFSDGTPLRSDAVAASLRVANPGWKIFSAGDAVAIELDAPDPELPAELALPRNSVVRRDGKLLGTGPFVASQWDPGKKLTLKARDDYWDGRAFLDSVEVEMGRGLREQMIALELGRADLVEAAAEQSRRAATEGRRVGRSAPLELMAIVFAHGPQSPEEARLREALSLSLDRKQLNQVLLQGGGEVSASLLPNWMTGYSFLFPTDADLPRANQIRAEVRKVPTWTLGYDPGDTVARVIAERITLDARNAGLSIQPTASASADARLVRVPLASLDGRVALAELASVLGLPQPKLQSSSAEDLYAAENALLQTHRVLPLLHLRVVSVMSDSVQGWRGESSGSWRLPDVWLSVGKP